MMTVRPDRASLNRATLARQLLLRRTDLPVAEAVRQVVALQAQEPPSPYVAMWNRVADFDAADLDAAFRDLQIVKAQLIRITLHAVHARDRPAFYAAMLPRLRASRLFDRRLTSTGVTSGDVDALLPHLLDRAATPVTRADVEEWLAAHAGGRVEPRIWWALRTYAPLLHAPTGGPWSFGRTPAFIAAPDHTQPLDHRVALRALIRRYLQGFGPATIADIAQFTMQKRTDIRAAVHSIDDQLTRVIASDGAELLDVPGGAIPPAATPAPPRLLGMWDSVLFAYADRSRVLPDEYRPLVIRRNGDALPTMLIDGYVAGVWRPADGRIEAHAFRPLGEDDWGRLADEAWRLAPLLARDPAMYRRYAHWFTKLPPHEMRLLPT